MLGLRIAAEQQERFARIVVANGFLPTGDRSLPPAFHVWKPLALRTPVFPTGRIVAVGCKRKLSSTERSAYDAPFPSARYQAGARRFPALVPASPRDPAAAANRAAWQVLGQWQTARVRPRWSDRAGQTARGLRLYDETVGSPSTQ